MWKVLKSNKLTDIESEAKIFLEGSNLYDQKKE
jgi:hypothetical protein